MVRIPRHVNRLFSSVRAFRPIGYLAWLQLVPNNASLRPRRPPQNHPRIYPRIVTGRPRCGGRMILFSELIVMLVAVAALCLARTRGTRCQVLALVYFGAVVAVMFFVFHLPDMAFSQIAVGAAALPLMVMLAVTRMNHRSEQERRTAK